MPARRNYLMDTNRILAELRTERDRIDRALAAIAGLNSSGLGRVNRPASKATQSRGRRLSAATRRKLSRLMKQRWAQGKMKSRVEAKPSQASRPARRMSAAGRKRISQAAKRRWAEWRRVQKKPVAKAA
jgi:hypothetical protein